MKQIEVLSSVLIFSMTTLLLSCSEDANFQQPDSLDEKQGQEIEVRSTDDDIQIYQDVVFHEVIMDKLWIMNNLSEDNANAIINDEAVNTILAGESEDPLTSEQKAQISELLGFNTFDDLLTYYEDLNDKMLYLDDTYGFSSFTEDQISEISLLYNPNDFGDIALAQGQTTCQGVYNGCIFSTNVTVAALHLGCIAADLTVVVGILCHASATAWGIAAVSDCDSAYNNCTGKSTNNGYNSFNNGLSQSVYLSSSLSCFD